jgi:phosphatidate cytidylyltransferase
LSAPSETVGEAQAARRRDDGALWKRLASAAVLIPVSLAAVHFGGAVFAAFVAFGAVVMTFEWTRMIDGRALSLTFYSSAAIGVASLALAAAGAFNFAFVLCALAALAAAATSRKRMWAAFGALYVLAPSAALLWLRAIPETGRDFAVMLLFIVWAADTGGYVAGRLVGGPKMSPSLSPAKTWAGAGGGLVLGALAGLVASRWIFKGEDALLFALAGGSLGLASILGDMAESAFKRRFGVKDMSGFIPGHGGALDRLDGLIFATTAMSLVLYLHALWGR